MEKNDRMIQFAGHIYDIINKKLGDAGECPTSHNSGPVNGREWFFAVICLWDDDFNDWGQIVQWFFDEGLTDVSITLIEHNLEFYIGDNKLRNGEAHDVAQAVLVQYSLPEEDNE